MKLNITNQFRLRHYAILLIMTATLVLTGAQKISAAEQKKLPYLIKVNRYHNTITIYEQDDAGEYSVPIKAITCSVGSKSRTVTGTFALKEKYRWKALMGDVWGQYSSRIVGGILFHSVYYYENNNPGSLATREYNKLGKAASHGCIRLTVIDAKWIYDNCPTGTVVEIFDDKSSPGPLGKPETIKIDANVRWDPTDPDERNPYLDRLPKLVGVKDRSIKWGEKVNPLDGITAFSSSGRDITKDVSFEGEINPYIAGVYKINYYVEDEYDRLKMKIARFTVEDCKDTPIIKGVKDKVVAKPSQITKKYALEGIELYSGSKKLERRLLQVMIEQKSDFEYYITYAIDLGNDNLEEEHATIYVDNIAPTLTGITDKAINRDQIPTKEDALIDIAVDDNFSSLTIEDVQVAMEQTEDGNYMITYTISDDVGNVCKTKARYYYQ